ncbi:MAG: TIGR03915 family putative DNA repair protein [Tannerellaceae bacterium]|nr:TIGR03915 family putative DNA repair protein [Tannerellaceae bacterium]
MLVFIYDRTLEGLLTAIFDAYSRRTFPDQLIGQGEPEPLFTQEVYRVITDPEKSNRVWGAVQKKISKYACNMWLCVWLSELPDCDELIFRYIRKVFDHPRSIEMNFADDDVLEVAKIAKKVGKEKHYLMEFVRFQKASDDIFFAPVSPLYNALPLAISFFKDRFSYQKWIIYDLKRKYGYYYDLKTVEEITLSDDTHLLTGKLNEDLMAQDEKLFQELWKNYFNALTIQERINPKLQRQHMPRRFWKFLTEKQ